MVIEKISLSKLQSYLDFFNKMYDAVRLVDPLHKKVIEYQNNGSQEAAEACYSYWSSGRICENCVSVRAYKEQKSFMKLEHCPNAIMLVTALPVDTQEQAVVLELLKNATDTMMIGKGDYNKGAVLFNAVQDINDMVVRDELTSLYNRRFMDDRLPVDIVNAMVNKRPISVIFIDVDNLKNTNDLFGHCAGDQILKCAADVIQRSIRTNLDWAARYGGDEFVVCLNNASYEEASEISEGIYTAFATTSCSIQGQNIPITVSQGLVTMPEAGMTADELIRLADEKMYEEKRRRKVNR